MKYVFSFAVVYIYNTDTCLYETQCKEYYFILDRYVYFKWLQRRIRKYILFPYYIKRKRLAGFTNLSGAYQRKESFFMQ